VWVNNCWRRPDGHSLGVPRFKRSRSRIQADARIDRIVTELGAAIAVARRRRALTQATLAAVVGVSQSTLSRIELGDAAGLPLAHWIRLANALEVPIRFELGRDPLASPLDAGHLELQELLLHQGAAHGYHASAEVPVGRAPWSVDVIWRSDARRLILVLEAWNAVADIGAGVRSFTRKMGELSATFRAGAGAFADAGAFRVAGCWVLRDVARNRELLQRYPHVFAAALPGSSRAWVRALSVGTEPPLEPGLILCDPARHQFGEWRP
jgi:transcriptional regulator with XRE-family HTH domain